MESTESIADVEQQPPQCIRDIKDGVEACAVIHWTNDSAICTPVAPSTPVILREHPRFDHGENGEVRTRLCISRFDL